MTKSWQDVEACISSQSANAVFNLRHERSNSKASRQKPYFRRVDPSAQEEILALSRSLLPMARLPQSRPDRISEGIYACTAACVHTFMDNETCVRLSHTRFGVNKFAAKCSRSPAMVVASRRSWPVAPHLAHLWATAMNCPVPERGTSRQVLTRMRRPPIQQNKCVSVKDAKEPVN